MTYQNYKKHFFYPTFALMLAIGLLAMSNTLVKSQRETETIPSPFKFKRFPAPKKDAANITPAAPTLAGSLERRGTTHFGSRESASAVAVQTDGKIVAAGTTDVDGNFNSYNYDFAVIRYNADGSLDTSFDADGKVTTSFNTPSSAANAVRVQRNGKIVAVGVSLNNSTARDFALARYNPDGSLDTTFDSDGKQTTDFFGRDDTALAAAIQRDGKIVAAGSASRGAQYDFAAALYTGDATRKVQHDYDDDGLADLSVFRPSNGTWYLNRSTQGFTAAQFGLSTDRLAPADYDGDGKTDIAVFRDGFWYWLGSRNGNFNAVQFGSPGDIPVPADYIWGDGRAELAVYRSGVWYALNLANNQFEGFQFGLATDKPIVGDYDGDSLADHAVYRDGTWYIQQSAQGFAAIQFGVSTDKAVPADYDGDGKTDPAVYRNGTWYLLRSSQGFAAFQFGVSTDIPAPADYDGDGRADAAVYRDNTWYLQQSSQGFAVAQFGATGDKPIPNAFVP